MSRERVRLLLACLATLALVAPLAYLWQQSRVPSSYSVMDMGYLDHGGGSRMSGMGATARPVSSLAVDPDRPADEVVDLVARHQSVRLASGRRFDGYTLNGTTPGPTITVTEGQLLEVRLRNADVPDGITLHWHGVDVPNAEDGVAGVTQDAVMPGHRYTYRFVADQAGTFWYHSHQVSHEQVRGGLLGALVVEPGAPPPDVANRVVVLHTYDGVPTLGGADRMRVPARPGQRVRLRVVNSDNGPTRVWSTVPYRVMAVDGTDVHGPTDVTGRSLTLTAGGRADVEVTAPRDGSVARVEVGTSPVLVGPTSAAAVGRAPPAPGRRLDMLSYGARAPLGFDPGRADRRFRYAVGRRPGFVKGKPGLFWSVNGHLFPNVPMFVVKEGDVVRVRISNSSGGVHPMHLHGHHAVVLSRNGVKATGSPWWFDSLNVEDGETYDVAFVADNPGIWMDHCHNLDHAQQGLVTHLMYTGVTEPYRVGGRSHNEPE